jgi:thymidylate synthase (FAD)
MRETVLDHGYVQLVESWGSDERIIEAARMSTQKGFKGWGTPEAPGDEKLLRYLWENEHATPFEMAGAIFEVKAPLFVFREWHRHRTQSYNEMSARYIPMPDDNYVPSYSRLGMTSPTKQAAGVSDYDDHLAMEWINELPGMYAALEKFYQKGLNAGIPKELARLVVPVGRYSIMRASANLRNWIGFLKLRSDEKAQWEIRQYANAVLTMLSFKFPRTLQIARKSITGG